MYHQIQLLRRRRQRGWGMVAALIVLAIIMILVLLQINEGSMSSKPTTNAIDAQLEVLKERNEQKYFTAPAQPTVQNPADGGTSITLAANANPNSNALTPKIGDGSDIDPNQPIQLSRPAPTPGPKQLPGLLNNIQRTRELGRELDVQTLNDNLTIWKLNNPDLEVTLENLQRTGFALPARRSHEKYVIRNGNIDIEVR